jgi:N-acetylneuraminic acid mutarotase
VTGDQKLVNTMKKKSLTQSAFLGPHVVVALLIFAAACSIVAGTIPAFLRLQAPSNSSQRTLTVEERVSYQRAIEEVYWRHRIWPKERQDPKPSLDAVMSQAQLKKKVTDYLRKSQALEDYWQRPITAEQLQAEMDRMTKHTKQPEVLQELFEALGNDPFVIAECLARPSLAERLLTNWYAFDQRIHGELKIRAEAELQAYNGVDQMKQASGKYSEVELVRGDSRETVGQAHRLPKRLAGRPSALQQQDAIHSVKLNYHDWDQTVERLVRICGDSSLATGVSAAQPARLPPQKPSLENAVPPAKDVSITQIKTGVLSSLREDENRYYATAVIQKTKDHLKLATVSWTKEPLGAWLHRVENETTQVVLATDGNYTLPEISGGSCIVDTWTATAGPPDSRSSHTAIWTGSEMIVWGGLGSLGSTDLDSGARYNPSTDTWAVTSAVNAPTARAYHTAVWTGSEMIVWGGYSQGGGGVLNTGGTYNPSLDSWTATSTTDAPTGRENHTAIWTGSEMIVWGGYDTSGFVANTGGKYNAGTNSWIATSTTNAPVARSGHTAAWTGSEMIVWGGYDNNTDVNTGARYDPGTNDWTATSTINAPSGRSNHTAVWTGSEMIIWGGSGDLNTGGRYNPNTDSWTATASGNAPDGRFVHTAVWTGNEMIIWGGYSFAVGLLNTGGRYDPGTDSWAATSPDNAPEARRQHIAVWTGSEMIVWGGTAFGDVNTGGRYDPGTNSWTATGTANAPSTRAYHTAVWTGSEMVIWGGSGAFGGLNTGGRYNPSTDNWTATNLTNAPDARASHTAVWSGSEMIVWGGGGDFGVLNTGGKYNPSTDSWVATSTASAPSGRYGHSAVWTGGEMIVWGGTNDSSTFNTGGRYNSGTDSWTATTTTNAPAARSSHTAVWTGSEMIVWGGGVVANFLDTGGRYNPSTNSWVATSTANAPDPRGKHTTVWTGNEMIIWGGFTCLAPFNCEPSDTGGRYNSSTDSWSATSITNPPSARYSHTAVWTGSEMIIWGGTDHVDTGGRYNPSEDSWTATNKTNAPTGREAHTSVWAGNNMIVWGGTGGFDDFNSGGRYCATRRPTPRPRPTPHHRPTPP